MELRVTFRNPQQREFYYSQNRNQCFSGGFNNGKSYVGCLKILTLLITFNNSRAAICRQTYTDLKKTTMETFFKLCPKDLIASHNLQDGLTVLKNGSKIYWMHLDNVEESTLRGLEINWVLVDQAEETDEKVYDILEARIGRWEMGEVPQYLLNNYPNWPIQNDRYVLPSYIILLCNPDTQFHYIYRKYHPDSINRIPDYFFVEGQWDQNLGSKESYQAALRHDPEWVNKYVKGLWGISDVQIHRLWSESILEYNAELIDKIKRKGNLWRILDHGDSSPTCCLWLAAFQGTFIFYREYYVPNKTISYHRREIFDLSAGEQYSANYADPQIFKKTGQKEGAFWTTSDEYSTTDLNAPPLYWIPADNNEFATRNRINELLVPDPNSIHPITGVSPAPKIYFIKKSPEYPNGCSHSITELQSQRKKILGYFDGKAIYSDDREDSVADHAYDCIRYAVAMHGSGRNSPKSKPPRMSIQYYRMISKMLKDREPEPLSA